MAVGLSGYFGPTGLFFQDDFQGKNRSFRLSLFFDPSSVCAAFCSHLALRGNGRPLHIPFGNRIVAHHRLLSSTVVGQTKNGIP